MSNYQQIDQTLRLAARLSTAITLCLGWGGHSLAQTTPATDLSTADATAQVANSATPPTSTSATSAEGEIIVTARKRDETSIAVPVTLTAVGGAELARRGIASLDNLTSVVPALMIGSTGGSVQGGNIVVRGIGGADSNPFADQAVSFNVDGVQIARANIRRMAELDLGQIEVLKGPQALFFGKNSPGGIISIRSADPTSTFKAKITAGHEFNAREFRGEAFVSGPLTDTLGARIAAYGSTMRGWEDNDFADSSIYAPKDKRLPKAREFGVRGTLKWEPIDTFTARLKLSYNKLKDAGLYTSNERIDCPVTPVFSGTPDDCRPNGHMVRRDLGPLVGTLDARFRDGVPYLDQDQLLTAYEMNYDISDALTFTSVTGYYRLRAKYADNFNLGFNPATILASLGAFGVNEFSEEVRLTSDYDGPINFTAGGFYQKARAFTAARTFLGVVPNGVNPPTQLNNYFLRQRGEAYSAFGQLMVKPVDVIEISAGGRYSYERKRLATVNSANSASLELAPVPINPLAPRSDSWKNFSPEASVSYRPTSQLTVFGSYKRGFLSGGFNSGANNFNSDLRFNQQKIKGFEGGIKASLLDGALRTNLSIYDYTVTGLQVTTSITSSTGAQVQQVTNAGKVGIKGGEFDFTYRTPFNGLSVRGAAAYNNGKYSRFSIGCYRGQTQALGCNAGVPSAAGTFATQDLAGARLAKAPRWTGSAGIGYESDVGSSFRFGANVDASYSSSYFTDLTNKPASRQPKYGMLDGSVRLSTQDEAYEVALIGRNLTDRYYVQRTIDTPLAGSAAGGLSGVLADTQGAVNRGREVMLRFTARFGQ